MIDIDRPDEYPFVIDWRKLPDEGRSFLLKPSEDLLPSIADRLGVLSVQSLRGEAHVSVANGLVIVSGQLTGALERKCVVTLEAMIEPLRDEFQLRFAPSRMGAIPYGDDESDLDSPEPLDGDSLDLGEILIQQAALAMAAHPRKSGAEDIIAAYGEEDDTSPFAVLKNRVSGPDA
ncbi:MAG: DUF177 domain-containing protein [Pseudomonadota bacterium]